LDREVEGDWFFRVWTISAGHQCWRVERTEEVVEEFTDVFVGLESIINGGLEFSIHVPEVELGLAVD